ncbi:MAG: hypothetical protein OEV63_10080 [Gammaproteobacteria bacterium]|nr:hypothetical protein [Gammaproteobacteria bacterium]
MINGDDMLLPILKASPSFRPTWDEFLAEWKDETSHPVYLVLSDLARHIAELKRNSREAELRAIFEIVEMWHVDGDSYVKEAATIGLLEDLQNSNLVGDLSKSFVDYLGPESKGWWCKVERFWEFRELIADD